MDVRQWRELFMSFLLAHSDVEPLEAAEYANVEIHAQRMTYDDSPESWDDPEAVAMEVMQDWDQGLDEGPHA